ncbi:MAG: hypothetical protein ABW199_00405 [Caulobacterales bacterium]
MTEDTLRSARAGLERVEEAARDQIQAAGSVAKDGVELAREFVERNARERPLATLGAALSVGLLLGVVLFGRRD